MRASHISLIFWFLLAPSEFPSHEEGLLGEDLGSFSLDLPSSRKRFRESRWGYRTGEEVDNESVEEMFDGKEEEGHN